MLENEKWRWTLHPEDQADAIKSNLYGAVNVAKALPEALPKTDAALRPGGPRSPLRYAAFTLRSQSKSEAPRNNKIKLNQATHIFAP